jgi:hypothetical protein
MTLQSKASIPEPFLSSDRRNQTGNTIKTSAGDDSSQTIAPRPAAGGAKIAR